MADTCETCHFWGNPPGAHVATYKGSAHCLRYPPSLIEGNMGVFPHTSAETWCGEFAPSFAGPKVAPTPPVVTPVVTPHVVNTHVVTPIPPVKP